LNLKNLISLQVAGDSMTFIVINLNRLHFIIFFSLYLFFPQQSTYANTSKVEQNTMISFDGNNGGPYVMPGGRHDVQIEALSGKKFTLKITVNCLHPDDYISCSGTIFQSSATGIGTGAILTVVTSQGHCDSSGLYAPTTFTSPFTNCLTGLPYSLNFSCLNMTTYTATVPAITSSTDPFICIA